jgi:hypothetical protein
VRLELQTGDTLYGDTAEDVVRAWKNAGPFDGEGDDQTFFAAVLPLLRGWDVARTAQIHFPEAATLDATSFLALVETIGMGVVHRGGGNRPAVPSSVFARQGSDLPWAMLFAQGQALPGLMQWGAEGVARILPLHDGHVLRAYQTRGQGWSVAFAMGIDDPKGWLRADGSLGPKDAAGASFFQTTQQAEGAIRAFLASR